MKTLLAALVLAFNLSTIKPAQSAVILYVNGAEFISYGMCPMWENAIDMSTNVVECTDLGMMPPWDYPYPAAPPSSNTGMAGASQAVTHMDGSSTPFMSSKTIKAFKKAVKKGDKLSGKKLQKLLSHQGKTDKKLFKDAAESWKLKDQEVDDRLRDRGKLLSPNDTCIDEVYNERKKIWKKMGLAPLQVFTGGLVGAGAGAGGSAAAIAAAGTRKLPEILASMGITTGSIVGNAAMYGTAIGAVGMAAYVLVKEVYHGVQLVRNAKMINLLAQARMPRRYGMDRSFEKFARKIRGKKRKSFLEHKDKEIVSSMMGDLDKSAALCADGEVMSYGKFKRRLKKWGKKINKKKGYDAYMSCNAQGSSVTCKVKEKAHRANCKSQQRAMNEGESVFFSVNKEGKCTFSDQLNKNIPTVKLRMNKGEIIPVLAQMPADSDLVEFKIKARDKVTVLRTRNKLHEEGSTEGQNCLYETRSANSSTGEVVHHRARVEGRYSEKASFGGKSCQVSVGDDGTVEVSMKAKEKANKTKCSSNLRSSGNGSDVTFNPMMTGMPMKAGKTANESCAIATLRKTDGSPIIEWTHEVSVSRTGRNPQTGKEIKIAAKTVTRDHSTPGGNISRDSYCGVVMGMGQTTHRSCTFEGQGGTSTCDMKVAYGGGNGEEVEVKISTRK